MKIDFDVIRELLAVFSQTDITELAIESGDEKITVKKSAPPASHGQTTTVLEFPKMAALPAAIQSNFAPEPQETPGEPAASSNLITIACPMVGTFYRSPSPSAPPFVEVGDRVTIGQTVCIIEAMKLMNDLPSEVGGRVVKVCVESGSTVEYGQPLFMIDPNG